jgi:hypothetical protein
MTMNSPDFVSETLPLTPPQIEAVNRQLQKMLGSRHFNQSRRYPALLEFLVHAALRGESETLRERLIGHVVFDRPADYDTNSDPIVRMTASEVRKRIAQYYHEDGHADELRIELRSGGYAPEFLFPSTNDATPYLPAPSADLSLMHPIATFSQAELEPEFAPSVRSEFSATKSRHISKKTLFWVAAALLISLAGLIARDRILRQPPSAVQFVWTPLLNTQRPVLVCIGVPSSVPYDFIERKASGKDLPLVDSLLSENIVNFSDVEAAARLIALLGSHDQPYKLQTSTSTSFSDLREGPVVYIGGLDNQWARKASSSLPFHFAGPADRSFWIEDSKNPAFRGWQVNFNKSMNDLLEDFALIARFTDKSTGQVTVIVAGIGSSGTRAASEFLTNEKELKEFSKTAPVNWAKGNFEIILNSEAVSGVPGAPRVVGQTFW